MEVWVSVCVCECVWWRVWFHVSGPVWMSSVLSFRRAACLAHPTKHHPAHEQPMGEFLFPSCLFYCTYFWAARHMAGSVTTVRPVETKTSSICKASGPTPGISPNTCGAGRRQKVK